MLRMSLVTNSSHLFFFRLGRLWNNQAASVTMAVRPQDRPGFMGGKQLGFSDDEQTTAKKQINLEKLLAKMEAVLPCKALIRADRAQLPASGEGALLIRWPHR